MEDGKTRLENTLEAASKRTPTEIHVHLSRRWLERDPFTRATELYGRFASSTALLEKDGILIYVNLRRRKFALYVDDKPLKTAGPEFFETLAQELSTLLARERPQVALSQLVKKIADKLSAS